MEPVIVNMKMTTQEESSSLSICSADKKDPSRAGLLEIEVPIEWE